MTKVVSLSKKRATKESEDLAASQSTSPVEIEAPRSEELVFLDDEKNEIENPAGLEQPFTVLCPNARSGSYKKAFAALGVKIVLPFDTNSSAGDWGFLVKRGKDWFYADQRLDMHTGGFFYDIGEEPIFNIASGDERYDMIECIRQKDPDYVRDL